MKMFANMFRRFAPTFMLCAAALLAAIPALAAKPGVPVFNHLFPIPAGGAIAGYRAPADDGGTAISDYRFAAQIVDCETNPEWNEVDRHATGTDGVTIREIPINIFYTRTETTTLVFPGSDCNFAVSGSSNNYITVQPEGIGNTGYLLGPSAGTPWTGYATAVRMRANNGELGDWSPYQYAVLGAPLPVCSESGVNVAPSRNGFSVSWPYCKENLGENHRAAPDGFDIRWRRINTDGSAGAWTLYPSESQKQASATNLSFDTAANKTAAPAVARVSYVAACRETYAALPGNLIVLCNRTINQSFFIDDIDFSPHRGQFEVQVAAYNEYGRSAWKGALTAENTPKIVTAGGNDTALSALELRAPDGTFYPLLGGLSETASTRLFSAGTKTYFAKIPKAPATVNIRLTTGERGATVAYDGMRVPEVFGMPGTFTFAADSADGITTYNFTITSANTAATRNYSLEVNRIETVPIMCTDADIPTPPTGLTVFNYVPRANLMQAYWTKPPDTDNGGKNVSFLHGWVNRTFSTSFSGGVYLGGQAAGYPNALQSRRNPINCNPNHSTEIMEVLDTNDDCYAFSNSTSIPDIFRNSEAQAFLAVAIKNKCGFSDFAIKEFKFSTPYAQTITAAGVGENNVVRLDWENSGNIAIGHNINNARDGMSIRWRNASTGEKFLAPGTSPTAAVNRAIDVAVPGATTFYEIPSGTLTDTGVYEFQIAPYNTFGRNAWSDGHEVLVGASEASLLTLEARASGGDILPLLDATGADAVSVSFAPETRAYSLKVPAAETQITFRFTAPTSASVAAGGATLTPESDGAYVFVIANPASGITNHIFRVTTADGNTDVDYTLTVNAIELALTALHAEVVAVAETPPSSNYESAAGDIINAEPVFNSAQLSYTLNLPYPVTTFRFIAPVNDADVFDADAGMAVLNENSTELYPYPVFENAADIPADAAIDDNVIAGEIAGENTRIISLNDFSGGSTLYEITVTRDAPELPPAQPTMLSATRDAMQLDLTWTAPASAQPITTYFVRWADTSTATATTTYMYINDGGENGVDTGVADATYTIADIDIATTYAIQVRAKSLRGIGEWSDELIRLGELAPGAPIMVDGNYVGAQITLTWSVPPVHPPVTSHLVRWADANAPDEWLNTNTAAGVDTADADETYVIRNLDQNLAYAVQVAAVNALATGAWSDVVNLAESGRPSAPTMLGAIREDAKITLTWAAPPPPVAPVETYFVRVALEPDLDTWLAGAGGTDGVDTGNIETSISFTFNAEFKKNIAYAMQVAAGNINGTGLWSKTLFSGVGDLHFVSEDETPDLFFHTKPLDRVVTLREATAGIPPYQYALDGEIPPGMSFVAETRELSGAPTAESAAVTLTYRITDRTEDRTATVITDEFDVTAVTVTTDVDGDNKSTAADGILIARYLLGVTDEALTFAQTATDAADIKTTLETAVKTTALNVNADTVTDADDGILIARYILGLRDDALELVANTAAEIAAKVEALLPAQ